MTVAVVVHRLFSKVHSVRSEYEVVLTDKSSSTNETRSTRAIQYCPDRELRYDCVGSAEHRMRAGDIPSVYYVIHGLVQSTENTNTELRRENWYSHCVPYSASSCRRPPSSVSPRFTHNIVIRACAVDASATVSYVNLSLLPRLSFEHYHTARSYLPVCPCSTGATTRRLFSLLSYTTLTVLTRFSLPSFECLLHRNVEECRC